MVVQHTAAQTSISIWSMSCLVAGIANFINATMVIDRIQYGRMVRSWTVVINQAYILR